jgi:16S rRNA (uracil1498-N3)-methyltransferase
LNILGKPLFYHPLIVPTEFSLSEEESRHCISSLRLKEGESIFITDGKGTIARAKIVKANPKSCSVQTVEKTEIQPSKIKRTLVIAPPKTGEKLDLIVEKAVEIGVDEIIFIETRYAERDKINLERLNKIAISAIKQSKQAFLPEISGMIKWKQFIERKAEGLKLIAAIVENTQSSVVNHLAKELLDSPLTTHHSQLTILIGPEGDFSEEELNQAMAKNFVPISLGKNILRTETASIYTLSLVNAFI